MTGVCEVKGNISSSLVVTCQYSLISAAMHWPHSKMGHSIKQPCLPSRVTVWLKSGVRYQIK